MSALPLLLVLLSAFLHAGWNALLKRAGAGEPAARAIMAGSFAAALLLSLILGLLLPTGPWFPRSSGLLWAAAAGLCEGAYFVTLVRALAQAPLGAAYAAMRGGATLLVWPLSVALLGERLTPLGAASALTMGLGILLLGGGELRRTHRAGLLWALAGAACIAGYHLAYKGALSRGALPLPLFAASIGTATLMRLGLDRLRGERSTFAWRGPVLLAALGCTASFGLFLWALRLGGAGLLLSLRNTSLVFAQLLALALGERPAPRQWLAVGLLTLGAVGLGLGR